MNKKILAILILFLLMGTIPKFARYYKINKIEPQKYTVYYELPSKNAEIPSLELMGEMTPYYSAQIYSKIDGLLAQRYVNIGDEVKKGQLLAVIDAPLIDNDKIAARANLSALQKSLIEAQYNLNYAKSTFERYKKAKNAVSTQEFKTKENDYNAAEMKLKIAKANIENAQAQFKRADEMKKYERITAPFDGIITNYNVDKGSNIVAGGSSTSTVLFEISKIDKLRLRANVPQSYIGQIENNKQIKFYIPEKPEIQYSGKIQRIQKAFDSISRTMKIEVVYDNQKNELYSGQYVKIIIPPANSKNFLIKSELVIVDSDGSRVLTVDKNNKLRFIPVLIGNDYGEVTEIAKGLKGDEKIVVNYNDSLSEGQEVIIKEAR